MSKSTWLVVSFACFAGLIGTASSRWVLEDSLRTLPPPPEEPAANAARLEPGWRSAASEQRKVNVSSAANKDATVSAHIRDWPCLAGPHRNSTSAERGLRWDWSPEGPPRLWQRDVGVGYSAPVVAGGQLIVHHRLGDEEHVTALDSETGEPLWDHATPTTYQCRYAYSNGPYATPMIGESAIFAVTAQGRLLSLDRETGQKNWERTLSADYEVPEPLFGVGGSPCLDDGRIYLNAGGVKSSAGVVAIDAATGETHWTSTSDGASYSTPVVATIHGRKHLFVFTEQGLVALDPESGEVRWRIPFGTSGSVDRVNAVTPLVDGDLVLVTAGPGPGALCIRVLPDGRYEEVWRDRRVLDSTYSNLTIDGGCVYGFTSRGRRSATFRCVELATGKLRWEWPSDLQRGSNLAVDGHAILLGEYGELAVVELNPDEPLLKSLTPEPILEAPTYSAPALSRGRLYLRNEKRVLCLDLRPRRD